MTVSYATQRDAVSKNIPIISNPGYNTPPTNTWTRPAAWPALPTIGPTDQKFAGVYQLSPGSTNYIALTATTNVGSFTVDWGDGTSPQNYGSGVAAEYLYTYAGSTPSYVVVTVTPTAGNLITVNLNKKYTVTGTTPALTLYTAPWLDIAIGSPFLNGPVLVSTGPAVVNFSKLQQFSLISMAAVTGLGDSFFATCTQLQSIPVFNISSAFTNFYKMFQGCTALKIAPQLTSSAASSNCDFMFDGCGALVYVPDPNININTMATAFQNCVSLTRAPRFKLTSTFLSMAGVFSGCTALTYVPDFPPLVAGASAFTAANAFQNCISLNYAPYIDLRTCTSTSFMFLNCRVLLSTPQYNTINVTDMSSMYQGCTSLFSIPTINTSNTANMVSFVAGSGITDFPKLNLSNVTNLSNAFFGCNSVVNFSSSFDIPNCTNLVATFANCSSLSSGPVILNSNKVTTTATMFANCSSLTSLTLFDTSNVTTMGSMFFSLSGYSSLITIPTFNTVNVTSTVTMFQNSNIATIPNLNLSNCLNFNNMLTGTKISEVPLFDTSKSQNVSAMFGAVNNLTYIPAFNLSNNTVSAGIFASGNALCKIDAYGLKFAINLANNKIGKSEIESFIANLGTNTTAQALNITSNPGADTAIAKTGSGITANSNVVTMATTTGITSGMYLYGTGIQSGIPVTFTDVGDTVKYTNALTNTPIVSNTQVMFTAITTTTGIVINTPYYAVNASTAGFQVSSTQGGSALPLTTNGTGTMTIGAPTGNNLPAVITTVNASNVIISGVAGLTNAAASLTVRSLNTTVASIKNWTITG